MSDESGLPTRLTSEGQSGESVSVPVGPHFAAFLNRSFGAIRTETIIIERVTGFECVSVVATIEASPPRARSSVAASAWAVSAA